MSNMSKKKIIAMMALVIVIAILGTGTLAYFTTKAVVHNVITTGGVGITLVEDFPNADENNKLEGAMPGGEYRKAVKVRNDEEEAWIRVRVTITADKGENPLTVTEIDFNEGTGETQWTKSGDWFYYNSAVAKGGETSYLFEDVAFAGAEMGNEYQNATFTIEVDAQAVQSANNPPQVADDVTTVQGWPD